MVLTTIEERIPPGNDVHLRGEDWQQWYDGGEWHFQFYSEEAYAWFNLVWGGGSAVDSPATSC